MARLAPGDIVCCEALSGGVHLERTAVTALLQALAYVAIDPDGAYMAGQMRRSADRRSPRTLGDASIAGLAKRLDASIVTRNGADFEPYEVAVIEYDLEGGSMGSVPGR